MDNDNKLIIYQVLPRLFGNDNGRCINNGSLADNGCGKMADFNAKALGEIKKLGVTHIWYTGIIEHATQTDYRRYDIRPDHPAVVKGRAGSPYAIKDYYDIDPDLARDVPGRMKEFENLIQRTHRAGLKVIIDFVPNHVARQYHSDVQPAGTFQLGEKDNPQQAFSAQNNFYYIPGKELQGSFDMRGTASEPYREYPAKATGNNRFDPYPGVNDWYETVKLNYGVDYMAGGVLRFHPIPDTWEKMLDILLFWAGKNIDGFRCDMAEMVPVEFWNWAIPKIKASYPDIIFIAEVYNPSEYRNYIYRGHFDYLYDKVGLYDTLRAVVCGNRPSTDITLCWQSLGGIENHMLNFLENHDEQRIASDFFTCGQPRMALPAFIVCACMNNNPVMLYFGQELGERGMDSEGFSGKDGRTTIFDYWSVPTIRCWRNGGKFDGKMLDDSEKTLQEDYSKILTICRKEEAIKQGNFFDLMYVNTTTPGFNTGRMYAFIRKYNDDILLVVVNFDPQPVHTAVNLPSHAFSFLGMEEKDDCEAHDLLSGEVLRISFCSSTPMQLNVPGYWGRVLKL